MSQHTQDSCDWQLAYIVKDTRLFPEAVWLCACGNMKKVSHHISGYRMHPDERIKHMRARAESAAYVEENDEHDQS